MPKGAKLEADFHCENIMIFKICLKSKVEVLTHCFVCCYIDSLQTYITWDTIQATQLHLEQFPFVIWFFNIGLKTTWLHKCWISCPLGYEICDIWSDFLHCYRDWAWQGASPGPPTVKQHHIWRYILCDITHVTAYMYMIWCDMIWFPALLQRLSVTGEQLEATTVI